MTKEQEPTIELVTAKSEVVNQCPPSPVCTPNVDCPPNTNCRPNNCWPAMGPCQPDCVPCPPSNPQPPRPPKR